VDRFENLRDLVVIMNDKATFEDHVKHVTKKVRQKIGWVLRTFYCRRTDFMKTMFKTLIVPHVDYCSQLWIQTKPGPILAVEKLQKDFLNGIQSLRGLDY
jgi:hypothetical protein